MTVTVCGTGTHTGGALASAALRGVHGLDGEGDVGGVRAPRIVGEVLGGGHIVAEEVRGGRYIGTITGFRSNVITEFEFTPERHASLV